MNLQNILNDIEKVDADVYERLDHVSRRHVFQSWMKKALAGVTPLAFSAVLNKAYAQNNVVVDVLNYALTLEFLEAEFYNRSLSSGIIPAAARAYYEQIAKHENAHVSLLQGALGSAAIRKPNFDFTAKGAFPTVFSDVQTNYALAQAFEDTGVRAYKGQAANLISAPAVLTVALQIHSVEARHAARIRFLRGQKGWITNSDASGLPAAIYAGEGSITQAGVNLTTLPGNINADRSSEAFDEILTKEQVLAIAGPFIA
ncbi:ferritin-like domain-containing protein [Spirosoma soli]|uniref:Ferritin-like domain-containing protein n=1 Tax=Spirosoma soli TaxID=1770529 RepID=A0ABW5M0U3_9BACT